MSNGKITDKKDLNEMLNLFQNQQKLSLAQNVITSIKKGNLEAAKTHVKDNNNPYLSVNPGLINNDDSNCNFTVEVPLFILAAIFDNVEYFEFLLEKNFDYKITGHICLTPKKKNSVISNLLGAACYYGSFRVLNFIINHNTLKTFFLSENQFSFKSIEKKNKDSKYSSNQKEMTGLTPILLSVLNRQNSKLAFDIFFKLYKLKNSSIDDKDSDGNNLLHLSVKANNIYIVKYLVNELNFDCSSQNNEHLTPIMIASKENNVELNNFFSSISTKNDQIEKDLNDLLNDDKNKKNKDKKKKKQVVSNVLELSNFELKTVSYPQTKIEKKEDIKSESNESVEKNESFKEIKKDNVQKTNYNYEKPNISQNENNYYSDKTRGYYNYNNYNKGYYYDNYGSYKNKNEYDYKNYGNYNEYTNSNTDYYSNKNSYKNKYTNNSSKKNEVRVIKELNDKENKADNSKEIPVNQPTNQVEEIIDNNIDSNINLNNSIKNRDQNEIDGNIRNSYENDVLSENVKANVEEFNNNIDNLVNESLPIKLVNEEDLAANSESLDSLLVSITLFRQQIRIY